VQDSKLAAELDKHIALVNVDEGGGDTAVLVERVGGVVSLE
jgi:hypothetical protein